MFEQMARDSHDDLVVTHNHRHDRTISSAARIRNGAPKRAGVSSQDST
jgi:hypothetical protein